ncbi:unnamed protein product [Amoebophrya sp. A25]|nr:unnamed protein product [Amoebophrya sp. A25]|eukprot:GSA25T00001363001.1
MSNKAASGPMTNILRRLGRSFDVVVFPEEVILKEGVERWPVCESKAVEYVKLRRPVEINSLQQQSLLRDRRLVYEKLRQYNIPTPNYVYVEDHHDSERFHETDDYIVWDGQKIYKPFVEKPLDGDDHNIYVYYPMSSGGGIKRLFRKVHNKSSEYDPATHAVRRNMPYIYEPFISTGGTDIKVYTVGLNYSHGEARKAPTVDGAVQRSKDGKEVRYPIILSQIEKQIAQTIVEAFAVCGFDILRTKGFFPVVCDVNGWSFVKGNSKYYEDCSLQLKRFFYERLKSGPSGEKWAMLTLEDDALQLTFADLPEEGAVATQSSGEELRSVLIIMRHGDRKPKEKLKFRTHHPVFLQYFTNDTGPSVGLMARRPLVEPGSGASSASNSKSKPGIRSPENTLDLDRIVHRPVKDCKLTSSPMGNRDGSLSLENDTGYDDSDLIARGRDNDDSREISEGKRTNTREICIKSVEDLKQLLGEVEGIIQELNDSLTHLGGGPLSGTHPVQREKTNMELLREILCLHDKFTGLNRKVQLWLYWRKFN